jgi:hypothetical protein
VVEDALDIALLVADGIERAGGEYFVGGSVASEQLWIKTPEDTVLRKLLWYREGGEVSDKQWRDIVGVLRVGVPELDVAYFDDWALRLGITGLLARARADGG